MIFCWIGSDSHYDIGIGNIVPVIGHGSAAETFRQTGDGGRMSYTGVVFEVNHSQCPVKFR